MPAVPCAREGCKRNINHESGLCHSHRPKVDEVAAPAAKAVAKTKAATKPRKATGTKPAASPVVVEQSAAPQVEATAPESSLATPPAPAVPDAAPCKRCDDQAMLVDSYRGMDGRTRGVYRCSRRHLLGRKTILVVP